MKLCLQYTSAEQKEHIKEAANLINGQDATLKGWSFIESGVYKSTYKKGLIVVKFNRLQNDNMHMLREIILYKEAPKKYKKHMARIFGGNGRKIIQEFIEVNVGAYWSDKETEKMREIGEFLGLDDYCPGHNAVKDFKNNIIFYDFSGHALRNI